VHPENNVSPEHPLVGKSIAIIGGGPAGAFCAYELARNGVEVRIFEDRSPKRPDFSAGEKRIPCTGCAGWLQADVTKLLADNGLEMSPEVVQSKTTFTSIVMPKTEANLRLNAPSTTVFRGFSPIHQFEGHPHVASLDGWLLEKAIDAGAKHLQVEISSIDLNEDSQGKVCIGDSTGLKYKTDLVIGAFGHNRRLMNTIQYPDSNPMRLEMPESQRAGVREYFIPKEFISRDLLESTFVFANPTPRIPFGTICPKGKFDQEPSGMYITIALMGRGDVAPDDFKDFLDNEQVKRLLHIDTQTKPRCACFPPLTVQSPRQFILPGRKDNVIMVNIGDAGPTRLRKNGIGSALDSAKHLSDILLRYGNSSEHMEIYKRYIERTYVRDNHVVNFVMHLSDFILNHDFTRRAVICLTDHNLGVVSQITQNTIERILTGKGPYWRIPIDVFLEIFANTSGPGE